MFSRFIKSYVANMWFGRLAYLISSKINFKLKTQLMQKWSQQFHIILFIFKSALLAWFLGTKFKRKRGYYMAAWRYEISLRVLKNISRVSAVNE